MISKRLHFPIFTLSILFLSAFYSCKNIDNEIVNIEYETAVEKGYDLYVNQKYDSALYHFYKAKLACDENQKKDFSYASYFIADIQQKQCDFAGSEDTSTEALKVNPNYESSISFYTLLGLNYQEQYNYKQALKYYNLSYSKATTQLFKSIIRNNIGYLYIEAGNYPKAIQILENTITNDSLKADKTNYAKVLDNLGYAYFKDDNPKSIVILKQSLQLRDSLKNDSELIASYIHLSAYYQKSDQAKASDFAQKAYNAATKINSPDDRIEALKFLIASSNTNETKDFALKQIQISDSITKVRQIAKNQFAKIKYDATKALEDAEKFKNQKEILLLLLLVISLTFVLIYYIIKNRNKRKLQTERYTTETRISKKLHDELANDVFNAMTFAETQNLQNPDKKETLLDNLDKIYIRTRNISQENSEIETNQDFEEFLKEMLYSYNNMHVNVIINQTNTINWNKIKREYKITIYRVLQELMVNMKKHSQSSIVVVSFENRQKTMEINYSDNGIGCKQMLKNKKGLLNVENRIKAIKGTTIFETETNKGFKVKITIPK